MGIGRPAGQPLGRPGGLLDPVTRPVMVPVEMTGLVTFGAALGHGRRDRNQAKRGDEAGEQTFCDVHGGPWVSTKKVGDHGSRSSERSNLDDTAEDTKPGAWRGGAVIADTGPRWHGPRSS